MNRRFKFRVWDNIKKEWWNKNFSINNHGNVEYVIDEGTWDMEDPIIQQFTGLLDSDGREIYEGDFLIDKNNSILEVFWLSGTASFQLTWSSKHDFPDDYDPPSFHLSSARKLKICGNILENRDLVK